VQQAARRERCGLGSGTWLHAYVTSLPKLVCHLRDFIRISAQVRRHFQFSSPHSLCIQIYVHMYLHTYGAARCTHVGRAQRWAT